MNRIQKSSIITGFVIAITSMFLLKIGNHAFAVEYTNYTSEKYKIQFEYPSHWRLIEHKLSGETYLVTYLSSDAARFSIYYNDPITRFGTLNVEEATKKFVSDALKEQLSIEVREVEKPTFITIDGEKAGTMVFAATEKYKSDPKKLGQQWWIVIVGTDAYSFAFSDSSNNFDSPENIQIRDHIIKSIKFIESTNSQQNIEPQKKSRFD